MIPSIKGPYKSIDPEEIIKEAEELLHLGTKELILVGQDITSYGIDKKGLPSLRELVREITSLKGDFWLRLLYLHPEGIRDDLIEEIAENPKICKYMDIPLQHSEKRILQLMRRPGSKEDYRRLLKRIREAIPDVTIRTTFIVGFPQEREEDFLALKDFVKEMEFDRLGVFKYSREEGSPAYSLKGQIPEKTKRRRFNELMKLQAEISLKKNLALVGKRFRVLIDEVERSIGGEVTVGGLTGGNAGSHRGKQSFPLCTPEVKVAFGRLQSQAPEIDGVVIIHDVTRDKIEPGLFKEVVITKAYEYDLEAKLAE